MATVTAHALVVFAKSKVGTPYVYGAKGDVLTQAQINTWAGLYPSVFTVNYIAKAKKFIGKRCVDCSGLISWITGIQRNSSGYRNSASKVVTIDKLDETMIGWGLWRSGHIGVYIGNGKLVEAKGINYGTVISNVDDCKFTHVLKLRDIDYGSKIVDGWRKEDGIWRYYEDGVMVKTKWIRTEAGYWYFFDQDGNLDTGWVKGDDGKWYYCDESTNDDLIGKMLTNTVVRSAGANYYLDKDGVMLTEGHEITFTIGKDGEMIVKEIK